MLRALKSACGPGGGERRRGRLDEAPHADVRQRAAELRRRVPRQQPAVLVEVHHPVGRRGVRYRRHVLHVREGREGRAEAAEALGAVDRDETVVIFNTANGLKWKMPEL